MRTIRIRADRLARSGAVPGMDADDIAQDLSLDLLERGRRFDPGRASFPTFVDRVTAHRVASLAAPTARLRAERAMLDLDAPLDGDGQGSTETLGDRLAETAALDGARPDTTAAHELREDVNRLLRALPPALRAVAEALREMSVAEAARALNLHRSTIYARIAAIRAIAVELGLQHYLGVDPTVPSAGR